jgi:hypothetical protein
MISGLREMGNTNEYPEAFVERGVDVILCGDAARFEVNFSAKAPLLRKNQLPFHLRRVEERRR